MILVAKVEPGIIYQWLDAKYVLRVARYVQIKSTSVGVRPSKYILRGRTCRYIQHWTDRVKHHGIIAILYSNLPHARSIQTLHYCHKGGLVAKYALLCTFMCAGCRCYWLLGTRCYAHLCGQVVVAIGC